MVCTQYLTIFWTNIDHKVYLECPDCHEQINVGTAGVENLNKRHRNTASCKGKQAKLKQQTALKSSQSMLANFLKPKAPYVPSTIKSSAPIGSHPAPQPVIEGDSHHDSNRDSNTNEKTPKLNNQLPINQEIDLLEAFDARIKQLPPSVGIADVHHPLSQFARDPGVGMEVGEDAWEVWDGPLNTVLQRGPTELHGLVRLGDNGLPGLCRFLRCLVTQHGVAMGLIEGKIQRLVRAMDEV